WGLAKVWDMEDDDDVERFVRSGIQQQNSGRLTGQGDVQGTPFYMSPEQARETGDVDGRTDIYNMGIILCEILTKQSYMSGRNFQEIKRKILEDPVRSPGDIIGKSAVAPELDAICLKALLKDPKDRYATMDDFVNDIRAYMLGKPISVYQPPPLQRLLNSGSRRTFNISSAMWMILGVLCCLIVQLLWRLTFG
ncbi:MAG: hypothetical protein KDA89_08895, partial [Planctomycetaceae bacterium]|nr:hypothetical protein [Planctomycetaceae bacterium]